MEILEECKAKDVLIAFEALKEVCPHLDRTDCAHPEAEFSRLLCDPSNCPLLLEDYE